MSEITRFNIEMPTELHREFKAACALKDRSMSDIAIELINKFLNKKLKNKE